MILSASTAAFSKGLNTARGQLNNFMSQVTSVKGALTGFAAAVGVGTAVRAVQQLVSTQMEAIDVTAKVADRLNVTTESLIGLRHAADLAGSSSEGLDDALDKMVKSFGSGNKSVAATVSVLGLQLDKLKNKSPDQAFIDIAEAISKIEDPAKRAKTATDIFGRSGQKLLNTLMLGRGGLEAATEDARKLGLSFSRLDAAKVEAANDAVSRLKAVLVGVGSQIAINIAPGIEGLANHFTDAATAGESMSQRVTKSMITLAKAVVIVADVVHTLHIAWLGLDAAFQKIVVGQLASIDVLLTAYTAMRDAIAGKSAVLGPIDKLRIEIDAARESANAAADAFKKAFEGQTPSERLKDFIAGLESTAMATDAARKRWEEYKKSIEQAKAAAAGVGSTPAIERGTAAALTAELSQQKRGPDPFKNFDRYFLTQEQMDRQMIDLQRQQLLEIKKKPKVARF